MWSRRTAHQLLLWLEYLYWKRRADVIRTRVVRCNEPFALAIVWLSACPVRVLCVVRRFPRRERMLPLHRNRSSYFHEIIIGGIFVDRRKRIAIHCAGRVTSWTDHGLMKWTNHWILKDRRTSLVSLCESLTVMFVPSDCFNKRSNWWRIVFTTMTSFITWRYDSMSIASCSPSSSGGSAVNGGLSETQRVNDLLKKSIF